MIVRNDTQQGRVPLFALAAGGMLFLPVFATCYAVDTCIRESYVQMGGSPLGYGLIIGVVISNLAVIGSVITHNRQLLGRVIWLAVIASFTLVILGAWSIGLAFLPGGVLLLLAGLSYRRQMAANSG
jgi:hypothetical protein